MSNNPYGPPPPGGQPPHGQGNQPNYGQGQGMPGAGQPAYGHNPGMAAPGQPMYGAGMPQLASWGQRVGAYLVDMLVTLPALLLIIPGYVMLISAATETMEVNETTGEVTTTGAASVPAMAFVLIFAGFILMFALHFWNRWIKGGKGQSIGKKALGISLLSEGTGAPIGTGSAFVRDLAHFLDGLPCYLGYLWPLWDDKRQTFSDKVMNTIVVQGPPPGGPR